MNESSEKRTLGPHFLIIGVIIVVILALVFWPSKEEEPVAPEPEVIQPDAEAPVEEVPDVFETKPAPPPLELEEPDEVPPMP